MLIRVGSLPKRAGSPGPQGRTSSAFGRVPPGVASDKDQGRLLQGQESPRNVSERSIRLSRISLSTAAGEEVPGTHTVLRLQPSGQSLGAESHALDDPRLGHPTSNTAVVGRCRPADQSAGLLTRPSSLRSFGQNFVANPSRTPSLTDIWAAWRR